MNNVNDSFGSIDSSMFWTEPEGADLHEYNEAMDSHHDIFQLKRADNVSADNVRADNVINRFRMSQWKSFNVHCFVIMCGHVKPIRDAITTCDIPDNDVVGVILNAFKAAILESVNPFRINPNKNPIDIDKLLRVGGYRRAGSCPFDVSYLSLVF